MDKVTIITSQISEFHQYVRTTGQITTQWYFFASTINAVAAGWIFVENGLNWEGLTSSFLFVLIGCDLALAIMYAYHIPKYYSSVRASIAQLLDELPENVRIKHALNVQPFNEWNLVARILAATYLIMAVLWIFYTIRIIFPKITMCLF